MEKTSKGHFRQLRYASFFCRSLSMILGMSTQAYTALHVLISLIAIGSGLVVTYGLLVSKRLNGITAIFLITAVLTSVTGFGFPFDRHHLTPGFKLGIISLVVLAIAILARYAFHLAGPWRRTYVITAAIALYLNVFVLVVQSFEKVPVLRAAAPKQTEPPFVVTQLIVLALFIVLTIFFAAVKFRVQPVAA